MKLIMESFWIAVVDDDTINLRIADYILKSEGMKVCCFKAAELLLDFLAKGNRPDLILLDVRMPGMDGFEALLRLRSSEQTRKIPVIFLTGDEQRETEAKGLAAGAADFIKKPFIPEVLLQRVRNIISLNRLQNNLEQEVRSKTEELSENKEKLARISKQIVSALAQAIDAKDEYTNGHSNRVANYSMEIARRCGYSQSYQDNIYMMGLLHDVGKIGIPDSIIHKPGKLTDEEYELVKTHPVMGAKILQNISEFPELAIGALWHHERYDGKGYPDGLAGDRIPDFARIIAVADAYDTMSSRRSYRDVLPQSIVRAEIERGKGTQHDPRFADIMLQMIDEDINYDMREKPAKN